MWVCEIYLGGEIMVKIFIWILFILQYIGALIYYFSNNIDKANYALLTCLLLIKLFNLTTEEK
jgi:hypothetical protein